MRRVRILLWNVITTGLVVTAIHLLFPSLPGGPLLLLVALVVGLARNAATGEPEPLDVWLLKQKEQDLEKKPPAPGEEPHVCADDDEFRNGPPAPGPNRG